MRIGPLLLVAAFLGGCLQPDEYVRPEESNLTAAHLVWSHPYPDLLIEVDYVEGLKPLPSTLLHFESTLRNLSDKREIRLLETSLPDDPRFHQEDHNWSLDELLTLTRETFDGGRLGRGGEGTTAFLHVLFLNGHAYSNDGDNVGGRRVEATLFIFPEQLNKVFGLAQPPPLAKRPSYDKIERWVITHELGHALGLVGGDVAMVHARKAADGTHHSTMPASPMFMRDRSDLSTLEPVNGEDYTPDEFDHYDLEDLAAFRERGRQLAPPDAYRSW